MLLSGFGVLTNGRNNGPIIVTSLALFLWADVGAATTTATMTATTTTAACGSVRAIIRHGPNLLVTTDGTTISFRPEETLVHTPFTKAMVGLAKVASNMTNAQHEEWEPLIDPLVERWETCMLKHGGNTLVNSQHAAYDSWLKNEFNPNDLQGSCDSSYNDGLFDHVNSGEIAPGVYVYEPCNSISNYAFYNSMAQVCVQENNDRKWALSPADQKAFVESMSLLGLGSTLFHGSNSKVGMLMDHLGMDAVMANLYASIPWGECTLQRDLVGLTTMFMNNGMKPADFAQHLINVTSHPIKDWDELHFEGLKAAGIPGGERAVVKFDLSFAVMLYIFLMRSLPVPVPGHAHKVLPQEFALEFLEELEKLIMGAHSTLSSSMPLLWSLSESCFDPIPDNLKWSAFHDTVAMGFLFSDALEYNGQYDQVKGRTALQDMMMNTSSVKKLIENTTSFSDDLNVVFNEINREHYSQVEWPVRDKCTNLEEKNYWTGHAVWHDWAAIALFQMFELVDKMTSLNFGM